MQCATLIAEIDHLRADQAKARMKDNPFKPAYDAAAASYNAYWAKVKQLQDKHRTATGEARVRLADDLKRMKGEDVRVGKALEDAKKKMTDWQDKNGAAPVTDPRIKSLQDQLAGLQVQIQSLDNDR